MIIYNQWTFQKYPWFFWMCLKNPRKSEKHFSGKSLSSCRYPSATLVPLSKSHYLLLFCHQMFFSSIYFDFASFRQTIVILPGFFFIPDSYRIWSWFLPDFLTRYLLDFYQIILPDCTWLSTRFLTRVYLIIYPISYQIVLDYFHIDYL